MTSHLKAYEDIDFLKRTECRSVRLQLEFLKPDLIMDEHDIRSTIVTFGSARLLPPETAKAQLDKARQEQHQYPESSDVQRRLKYAERQVELSQYYDTAREFAALVSRECQQNACPREYVVITGGGGGAMEAANRGADDVGAKSIGLNISLPYEQMPNAYATEELQFQFHYFSIRKMHFLLRARALCAFPGGYGTLDELFETLTLIQTRKIERIPVVLFGRSFWQELVNWDMLASYGLIDPEDMDIFTFCETPREAWDYIRSFWHE